MISAKRNRIALASVGAAIVLLGPAITAIAVLNRGSDEAAGAFSPTATVANTPANTPTHTSATATPTPAPFAGILDGVPMSASEWSAHKDLLPVAVMFDASPDAFPQSGLDKADVVYEAFVEGGITRFMGVYWRQEADYIEPVRSARTPFLIWADELGALYGHAGEADTDNAANAGGQLGEWKIFDLNAFAPVPSSAYYRNLQRYAPHNLVTSTTALRAAAAQMGYSGTPSVASWKFKANGEGTAAAPAAEGIEVNFGGSRIAWQLIQWRWDAASGTYLRNQFGGPHIDGQTNKQLQFTNVVVMQVPSRVVDAGGHVLLDQFGSGPATVFLDGKRIDGTWRKADRKDRTRFYDESGQEIAFNRGSTWIEVIGLQSSVSVFATAAELAPMPVYQPPPPFVPAGPGDETDVPEPTPTTAALPTAATPGTPAHPTAGSTPVEPSPPVTATIPPSSATPPGTQAPVTSTVAGPTPNASPTTR